MVFGMGYATNSTTLPALLTRGTLVVRTVTASSHVCMYYFCLPLTFYAADFRQQQPRFVGRWLPHR